MPSVLLGFLSGGTNLLSGNYFSGQGAFMPVGGVKLIMHPQNSGYVYVALSGGITINSGGFQQSGSFLSGLGSRDGMPIGPGISYFIDKIAFPPNVKSGVPGIYVQPDANCSGQARVFFEVL